jgi:hypothetical protein
VRRATRQQRAPVFEAIFTRKGELHIGQPRGWHRRLDGNQPHLGFFAQIVRIGEWWKHALPIIAGHESPSFLERPVSAKFGLEVREQTTAKRAG